ncbi:ABC transporter ATP-binding protein [Metabacillus fastidiosus]|uniref:ABC transporter ATP-binding protein n=1 Tax=Metabacillus fastidiosus TaxID=1458 RepID=UPI002E23C360|nr:ABC transporter ATP-binding protein [Metabacillus fastidiosus]
MKLQIKNVTKQFKGKTAVHEFSMELQSGQCVGLIGPNGAGKSTLLKMIANIIDPTSGEVLLNGQKISLRKKEIGYLPQYPNFFNWMTAKETLRFMGQLSGLTEEQLVKAIPEMLSKVGLAKEENSKISTFSGGMKQRLGIAQALLHRPALIIMDEPVSALDPIGRREVLNLIEEIKRETTVLLSTHILTDAEEICERFIIIKDGEKIKDTTIANLLRENNENQLYFEIGQKNEEWLKEMESLQCVKGIEVIGNRVKVSADNLDLSKNILIRTALDHHIDITKFEINSDSLEEIFLKLVVE